MSLGRTQPPASAAPVDPPVHEKLVRRSADSEFAALRKLYDVLLACVSPEELSYILSLIEHGSAGAMQRVTEALRVASKYDLQARRRFAQYLAGRIAARHAEGQTEHQGGDPFDTTA